MPVPPITDPPVPQNDASGKPSQKSMSKAERRELQEKQRAAKAALKDQPGGSKPQGAKPGSSAQGKVPKEQSGTTPGRTPQTATGSGPSRSNVPPTPHRTGFLTETSRRSAAKDANAADEVSNKSHGLRIFTHFGQPKPVSAVKGEIHPAIIKLGLLFSDFKICGANARCIATLTAFKQVCRSRVSFNLPAVMARIT